jgi:hypothetical protein
VAFPSISKPNKLQDLKSNVCLKNPTEKASWDLPTKNKNIWFEKYSDEEIPGIDASGSSLSFLFR